MIKASKIILLVLMLTMLVAFLGYSLNINYHSNTFMAGLPLYILVIIMTLLVLFYGINTIRNPVHKYAYLNFLIIALVPNMALIWVITKALQNYRSQFLPLIVIAVVIVVTYLTNIVIYARTRIR